MQITFTRDNENRCATTALRDDGVLLSVPSYDRKFPMPHDVAHYFVECGLGLQRGFWGSIADGALFPGITVVSGRQPARAGERSQAILREMGQQGTEAEVLVGVLLRIMHEKLENDVAASQALLAAEWRPAKPSRDRPQPEEVQRICAEMREAERKWQDLKPGESLTMTWPVAPRPHAARKPEKATVGGQKRGR